MYILSRPTLKCEKIKWALFSVAKSDRYDRYIFVAEWHSVTLYLHLIMMRLINVRFARAPSAARERTIIASDSASGWQETWGKRFFGKI